MIRSKNQRIMPDVHHLHMEIELGTGDLLPACSKAVSRFLKITFKRFEDDVQNIFAEQGIIALLRRGFSSLAKSKCSFTDIIHFPIGGFKGADIPFFR